MIENRTTSSTFPVEWTWRISMKKNCKKTQTRNLNDMWNFTERAAVQNIISENNQSRNRNSSDQKKLSQTKQWTSFWINWKFSTFQNGGVEDGRLGQPSAAEISSQLQSSLFRLSGFPRCHQSRSANQERGFGERAKCAQVIKGFGEQKNKKLLVMSAVHASETFFETGEIWTRNFKQVINKAFVFNNEVFFTSRRISLSYLSLLIWDALFKLQRVGVLNFCFWSQLNLDYLFEAFHLLNTLIITISCIT